MGWPPLLPTGETGNCGTQLAGGSGSVDSVVAAELSFVSEKEVDVMLMALAKLSFSGAGATTVNVGRGAGPKGGEKVVPPPGGGVWTPTEFVLPKLARKLAGTVAERCCESVKVVGIRTWPFI